MNKSVNLGLNKNRFRKQSLRDTTPRRTDLRGYPIQIQLSAYGGGLKFIKSVIAIIYFVKMQAADMVYMEKVIVK